MSKNYQQEKKKLIFTIHIIQGFTFDHNPLTDALLKALYLSEDMPEREALVYLAGLNKALGPHYKIARWTEEPVLLREAHDRLKAFINNYPKSRLSPWEIRGLALLSLIQSALLFLSCTFILVLGLLTLSLLALSPMSIGLQIFIGVLLISIEGISLTRIINRLTSFEDGLDKTDSRLELLFSGEPRKGKVNTSLLQEFSLFATIQVQQTKQHELPHNNMPLCLDNA